MKKSTGGIQLILGPMFSGKSSELIKLIRRFNVKKQKTVVVKYSFDNRYSQEDVVSTHDKFHYPAIKCVSLLEVKSILEEHDVIGIDEGQFFPDLLQVCEDLANKGKNIVISALNANFKREAFESILHIFPKCEKIINLQSICYFCNEDAPFTLRTVNNSEEILIGGIESYKPVCRSCYNKETKKEKSREDNKSNLVVVEKEINNTDSNNISPKSDSSSEYSKQDFNTPSKFDESPTKQLASIFEAEKN